MPTFTQIGTAQVVGAGGAASITFTSIPATYTDLVVKLSSRAATGGAVDVLVQFNSDTTGTNYTIRQIQGNGTSVSSSGGSGNQSGTSSGSTDTTSTFANSEIYITNYRISSNKNFSTDSVTENNATTAYQTLRSGIWNNTAAITSISLVHNGGANFAQHSTAYLYGVSNV
jgi:hypothetical protein